MASATRSSSRAAPCMAAPDATRCSAVASGRLLERGEGPALPETQACASRCRRRENRSRCGAAGGTSVSSRQPRAHTRTCSWFSSRVTAQVDVPSSGQQRRTMDRMQRCTWSEQPGARSMSARREGSGSNGVIRAWGFSSSTRATTRSQRRTSASRSSPASVASILDTSCGKHAATCSGARPLRMRRRARMVSKMLAARLHSSPPAPGAHSTAISQGRKARPSTREALVFGSLHALSSTSSTARRIFVSVALAPYMVHSKSTTCRRRQTLSSKWRL
mmetsp:Transcript_50729/g.127389  ORF Transcript_50729/g.127389 Transcript_50729/m.127389 type:complete len:276 (+) Transcript_50729:416-1243(+)